MPCIIKPNIPNLTQAGTIIGVRFMYMFNSKPVKYTKAKPPLNVRRTIQVATKGKRGGQSKLNSPTYKIPPTPRSSGFGWGG